MSLFKERSERLPYPFEQHARTVKLKLKQGDVTVLDAAPDNPLGVVTFMYGYGHDIDTVKGPLNELFHHDYRVLCTQSPHRGMNHEPDTTKAQQEAAIITGVLSQLGIELPTTAVAHSKSAKTAVRLAEEGAVNTMILINPPGISEPQTVPGFIRRAGSSMLGGVREVIFDRSTRISQPNHFKSTFGTIKGNVWEVVPTLKEIAEVDLRPRLRALHEQGVYVAILHGQEDRTFPLQEVIERVDEAHADYFQVLPGDHTNHLKQPKLVIGEVARILEQRPIQERSSQ